MARYLYVKNGIIVNVVEYSDPNNLPPDTDEEGSFIILESPQGTKNAGDAYDPTPDLNERYATKIDHVVLTELFRLTNVVRVLQGSGTLTAGQYRAFLKTLI